MTRLSKTSPYSFYLLGSRIAYKVEWFDDISSAPFVQRTLNLIQNILFHNVIVQLFGTAYTEGESTYFV